MRVLFQLAARRLAALAAPGLELAAPCIVGNDEHRFLVLDQLREIRLDPSSVLLEPMGRNTAPAIALAALEVMRRDPEGIMLVVPADHVVTGQREFQAAVSLATRLAKEGHLVTFGIKPIRPETGYGYIKPNGRALVGKLGTLKGYRVQKFLFKGLAPAR